jgi:hypothetical protein
VTEPTTPPEPADQTALYWPETATYTPAVLILRDDTAAAEIVAHATLARWCQPNTPDWLTWPQILEMLDDLELDLADAIRLTPGGAS